MSRVANNPVTLPKGVEVKVNGRELQVKGSKGALSLALFDGVDVSEQDGTVTVAYSDDAVKAMAGTTRALVNNMVKGVSDGW
jgi:large subunit ribosomal protein L6